MNEYVDTVEVAEQVQDAVPLAASISATAPKVQIMPKAEHELLTSFSNSDGNL